MDAPNATREDRPPLATTMSLHDFKGFYWLKEELVAFCRANDIKATGSKIELAQRIEHFLITGSSDVPEENKPVRSRQQRDLKPQEPLSVHTIITEAYTSSQANRAFFMSVIGPRFRFTTRFMQFCKNNVGKTYQDAIDEWYSEEWEKKNSTYQTTISPQFEYNQHIRDFMQDNPDKTLRDAIHAWNERKKQRREL